MRAINPGNGLIDIKVDSPTHGVAILDIAIDSGWTPAPLHWRVGDWTKPPLDVSLGLDGSPEGVQVVFQNEEVPLTSTIHAVEFEDAIPAFDIDAWPNSRYLDVKNGLQIERLGSGELAVMIGDPQPTRWLKLGEGLEFGFDAIGVLVTLIIGPLDNEQWQLIAACELE